MDSNIWTLILAQLPVSSYDSFYKVDKSFSELVKQKWRLKTFKDEYKKCHKNIHMYLIIVSFKDSYCAEGFYAEMTTEDKIWFEYWFFIKFGKGVSNFIMCKCDIDESLYDESLYHLPARKIKPEEIIIQGWIAKYDNLNLILKYEDIFLGHHRCSKSEECFRWANTLIVYKDRKNIIDCYNIFETIRFCNHEYILHHNDTLIDYKAVRSFDLENIVSSREERDDYKYDEFLITLTDHPSLLVDKWFEIERIEKAKTKTMYYCEPREFYNEKQTDKIFIRWSNMRGLYFAIYQNRGEDGFYAVFEDTMCRSFLTIGFTVDGYIVIHYPGYKVGTSQSIIDLPETFHIGRILPIQNEYHYRQDQYNYQFNKPPEETSPNEIIKIIIKWVNEIISKYAFTELL